MKTAALLAGLLAVATAAAAQNPPRPRPFPGTAPPPSADAQPPADPGAVDPALGVPIYPGATALGQYAAGPNQTIYLYGSTSSFANVVAYYKGMLKENGRQLFDGPMHQFDLGRFRRETMTLQPSVTVKDFTWNGREGYVHVDGTAIVTFPTIIQVVPATPGG
jgi:hypothetical protein